jgi:uncharacterized protein
VQSREAVNEYDLGLPIPLSPLTERQRSIPRGVWARLEQAKVHVAALLGPRLREVRLFGSYARGQFDDESDVDVLFLVDSLKVGERERVVDAILELSGRGVILSPLVLTVAQLERLRGQEKLLVQDLDREGICV